jgi:hypothetical protein
MTGKMSCIHQLFSIPLAFFHGERILFSSLIHSFFVLIGVAVLIYGLKKYKSRLGVLVATGYVAITLVVTLLSEQFNGLFEIIALGLTIPWRIVMPCYNLDESCSLSLGVSFVCALLNATILYFLVVWLSRERKELR